MRSWEGKEWRLKRERPMQYVETEDIGGGQRQVALRRECDTNP